MHVSFIKTDSLHDINRFTKHRKYLLVLLDTGLLNISFPIHVFYNGV